MAIKTFLFLFLKSSLIIIMRDAFLWFRDTKNGKEEKKSKKKSGVKNTSSDNLGNIFEIFGDDNPRQKTQPEEDKKFKTRPRSGKEGRNSGTTKPGNTYNRDNMYKVSSKIRVIISMVYD